MLRREVNTLRFIDGGVSVQMGGKGVDLANVISRGKVGGPSIAVLREEVGLGETNLRARVTGMRCC